MTSVHLTEHRARRSVRRSAAVAAAAVLMATGASACAGAEPEGAPVSPGGSVPRSSSPSVASPTIRLPRSTALPAEGAHPLPTIDSFEIGQPEACAAGSPDGAASGTLRATYATTGADRVVLVVDDVQFDGPTPTSGTIELPISCGSVTHFVVLIAANPDDKTAIERKTNVGHDGSPGQGT